MNIPVPRILDYNHNTSNEINIISSKYIIIEYTRGVPLHKKLLEGGSHIKKYILYTPSLNYT
ncbi:hypothetical protein BJX64DRAFT_78523 [Aspergillus heterothallicus]